MAFRAFELNVLVWSGMNENSFLLRALSETLNCHGLFFAIDDMHTIFVEIQDGF